ncbi:indole-3-glycerol phosphate synthase [Methanococcus voltae]|uniref:Indole-3-glycerol phosphate synthase n=2 Tax=Methanococcus voltae TaxID=2188 RepID=A0A8J7S5Z7_METVO|nr:indole-3-glycerol phosphate synthase TrpC [Methanococcus voltae]MBP2202023.1 indole-3-glycerol phosphate synthase [Methanococcus voltae]
MINFKRQANAIKNCNKTNKTNKTNKNAVIAEIKVHSPKYGDLLKQRNELDILKIYEEAGVVGISYITDKQYFNGDFDVFKEICKNTELPVLRKDFITKKAEIEKTAEAEASTVLLIPRILGEETAEFVDYANSCGLDTLVEVHNEQEIEIAKNTKTSMIGINNRDICKLELDDGTVSLTEKLANLIPKDRILVSESGISNLNDLNIALMYTDAVLIGTSFMKADFEIQKEFVKSFVGENYD